MELQSQEFEDDPKTATNERLRSCNTLRAVSTHNVRAKMALRKARFASPIRGDD
jgi:hypothetical protein